MSETHINQQLRAVARHKFLQLRRGKSIHTLPSRFNILVPIRDGSSLLFNSLSRSLCLLSLQETTLYQALVADPSAHDTVVDLKNNNEHRVLFKQLSAEGFCISDQLDELSLVQEQYHHARKDESSLGLTIAPTMDCNLACGYCFQGLDKARNAITDELEEKILHLIQNSSEALRRVSITWYGGEPLIKSQRLLTLSKKIIDLCADRNASYSSIVVSNGVYLNAKLAQKLIDHGCHLAQITVDGPAQLHDQMRPTKGGKGSFQLIMGNIGDVLANTTLQVTIRINVGKDNIDACGQLLDELELRGFHQYPQCNVYFAPIDASTEKSGSAFDVALGKDDFNRQIAPYRARAKRMGLINETVSPSGIMGLCVATKNADMVLAPNGEIHKCWETMHEPSQRTGQLIASDANKIASCIDDSQNKRLWDEWSPYDNPVCASCRIVPMCAGACAHRFIYFGSGGTHALPCPEWKWNTAELIFERAMEQGYVNADDWLEEAKTTLSQVAGEFHTPQTMTAARDALWAKIGNTDVQQSATNEAEIPP